MVHFPLKFSCLGQLIKQALNREFGMKLPFCIISWHLSGMIEIKIQAE